jgi:hypothetical protein
MKTLIARIAPAILLAVLAPVVAEFLLGDFTIRNLALVVALLPLYGCGALLIREMARRTRRGWPTILLLGIAFSLLEEGFLTQSLFNPDYAGQRLLDYGYLPALGTSLNWSLFVLSIHVVWSIATPILIAEGVASDRRTRPWLGVPGLVVTSVLFVLGCAATARFSLSLSPFVARPAQFGVVAVLVLLALGAAFSVGPGRDSFTHGPAPRPLWVFLSSLALSVAFMMSEFVARDHGMHPAVGVLTRLACHASAAGLIVTWSRRPTWAPRHYLAIAAGTTLTYALFGFSAFLQGHTHLGVPTDRIDLAGQIAIGAGVVLLIWWGARRSRSIAR